MTYGTIHRRLSEQLDDAVLIESPFMETSRAGKPWRSVLLALTRNKFVIISRKKLKYNPGVYYNRIESKYSLNKIKLVIFKKSNKQILKVNLNNKTEKYFELGKFIKRKIFWTLWCHHVKELNCVYKIWPFSNDNLGFDDDPPHDIDVIMSTPSSAQCKKKNCRRWTDKYLYLGSIRAAEDLDRPKPIPGLGNTGEIKLLYLKPEYFGCWDQAEHWVQAGDSIQDCSCASNAYTYTGEPTSNVTYTSLMTTWK